MSQKIEICLKSQELPDLNQTELAHWAQRQFGTARPASQTTISRILKSRNELLGSRAQDLQAVRRRKKSNPLLRNILTEWITQITWECLPVTTPIIQLTANLIWTRLPAHLRDGNGVFSQKWCMKFIKNLDADLGESEEAKAENLGHPLKRVWKIEDKVELKRYLGDMVKQYNYRRQDIFCIDEFSLYYLLPLDQIFDILAVDKGLKQAQTLTDQMITVMLGTNIDGSEKLPPIVVLKFDMFDVSASSHASLRRSSPATPAILADKLLETYNFTYRLNNNKWVTLRMFQEYLVLWNHRLQLQNRKVLVLLDNSLSHRIINLRLTHVRLVYAENALKHANPFSGTFSGMRYDYTPMTFGIVQEFKTLYRLQQYREMIAVQRRECVGNALKVLSEKDYHVPFVRALEWIRALWEQVSSDQIQELWRKTHLFDSSMVGGQKHDVSANLSRLSQTMASLNVVIPWDVEELLGLVNERIKVMLDYVLIDEMVESCVNDRVDEHAARHAEVEWSYGLDSQVTINKSGNKVDDLLDAARGSKRPVSASENHKRTVRHAGDRELAASLRYLLTSVDVELSPVAVEELRHNLARVAGRMPDEADDSDASQSENGVSGTDQLA